MTKTLTEKWREGTLRGCFYWKLPNGNICTAYTDTMRDMKNVRDSNEVEVLEEAPSYYEYQDIIQQNVNQEAAIETYIEDIKRLEEQLKIAKKALKDVSLSLWDEMECRSCAKQALTKMEGVK